MCPLLLTFFFSSRILLLSVSLLFPVSTVAVISNEGRTIPTHTHRLCHITTKRNRREEQNRQGKNKTTTTKKMCHTRAWIHGPGMLCTHTLPGSVHIVLLLAHSSAAMRLAVRLLTIRSWHGVGAIVLYCSFFFLYLLSLFVRYFETSSKS